MARVDELEAEIRTLSPGVTADLLGVAESTLANMRWRGDGPPYVKIGGKVRYLLSGPSSVREWLDARVRTSTSFNGTPPSGSPQP